MVLNSELLERFIRTFLGYGNADAPYWYLGMEEGGDSTAASLKRHLELWRERGSSTLEDLRDYHLSTGRNEFFCPPTKLQTTWKQLIRITFGAEDRRCDLEAMREYQAQRLGRLDGETALLELYPLPAKGLFHWPYSTMSDLPLLRDRDTYLKEVGPMRIRLIQELIDQRQPQFVVMSEHPTESGGSASMATSSINFANPFCFTASEVVPK
jgi:hypothetical protein